MSFAWYKQMHFKGAIVPVAAWTAFILLLAGTTVYMHHQDVLHEARNEARDYFRLNLAYRSWAAELGGVYARTDRVTPNPYLKIPQRDVTTTEGLPLTLINPAYMSRMVFDSIKKSTPNPVISKITSLKPLNPHNAADGWEHEALLQFEQGGDTERSQVTEIGGKPYLRFISVFLTEPPCLRCHASQGYKVGDVRGGITISIPLGGYYQSEWMTSRGLLTGYLLLWVVGSCGIAASARRRRDYEEELRASERFNVSLNRISQAFLTSSDESRMYRELLVALLEIMDSPSGMVGYLDDAGDLVCSAALMGGYEPNQTHVVFPAGIWGDTLWGVALRQGMASHSNTPQVLPDGHFGVDRCLIVPLVCQGRPIALLMVANRGSDYTDEDLQMLQAIGAQVAPVLRARIEQQRAVAALKENESKLQVIFDVTQAGIIQIDSAGVVTFANQRMTEMFGMSLGELLGSIYCLHVCPDQREESDLSLRRLLDGEMESAQHERHYLRKDGTQFWGYLTGRRLIVADETQATLVATITDMTELKSAEEKRHKSEQQMLHVQKLESLGVLAGGIAHDFNNILLAIMGNTSLALQRVDPGSPVETYLRQVERASEKAADLARQMLAYSGKGRFVLEALDLNRLVREMTSMLEVSLSKKASLRFHLSEPLPGIVADPTQIRQIIMNLAINASEAIGENSGVITISTGSLDCDRSYLAESWLNEELPEGHYVFLEISDTGCGMSNETIARIFEPFFTTKFTGRGLGMAAILGIVRGHKGVIKVYSEPGKGSSFKVLFPASERPAEQASSKNIDAGWKGNGTVLLVDDEETVREVASAMLSELGYDVISAVDGRDALEKYRLHGDRISLVLMDLNMPNLNGEEAFLELRRLYSHVRVILSSGFSEQEVTRKFLGKGLEGFVQKPYTLAALRNVVSRLTSS